MKRNNGDVVYTRPVSLSKFGILSPAVEVIEDSNEDWIAGFTYDTVDGAVESSNATIMGISTQQEETVVASADEDLFRFYYPFDVRTTIAVSTMGTNPAQVLQQASTALNIVIQKNIESEFWTGAIAAQLDAATADNRYLTQTGSVNVTPGGSTTVGVKPRHGLALLERALGDATIGSQGVIHATRDVASVLKLNDKKDTLTTRLGNFVVAGSGYDGTGPTGASVAAGKAWMYATGPVTVRLGKIHVVPEELGQAVDISNNTIKYYVDRPAAVTWCTTNLYAVLVDLSLDLA